MVVYASIPVFVRHPEQQVVARDASEGHQNVESTKLLSRASRGLLHRAATGDVHGQRQGAPTAGTDRVGSLFGRACIHVSHHDRRALDRKSTRLNSSHI